MKKVSFEEVEVVVSINNIDNSSHVGILWKGNTKGMVVRVREGYCIMNNDTNLQLGGIHNPSKKEYLKDRLANGDMKEVYVFDSYRELLEWFTNF